jgi:hypothetical protein
VRFPPGYSTAWQVRDIDGSSCSRPLLLRLYPSGTLAEQDYEFLRDKHGLPRELVTTLLDEREPS